MQQGTVRSYVSGFALSVLLTLVPFWLVANHVIGGWMLILALVAFAIGQLMVQLVFFLHLGNETGVRWNLVALLFAVLVVVIVVIGSLWIMQNLDYNMKMSPQQMDDHMMHQRQKGF